MFLYRLKEFVMVVLLICGLLMTGCTDQNETETTSNDGAALGSLKTALTSIGSEGNVFRLRYATFDISGPQPMSVSSEDYLDEGVIEVLLEVGSYQVELIHGWQMEMIRDGVFVPVDADLDSENPTAFNIADDATTGVVFVFLADGEVVPIGDGTLQLSMDVIEQDTTPCEGCCDTADLDELVSSGFCGPIPSALIESGCTLTYDWSRTGGNSTSSGERLVACTNGVWGEVEQAGGGGPCSGCPPYFEDEWYTEGCDMNFTTPVTNCTERVDCEACNIDGLCYDENEVNPDNPCQVCNSALNVTAWSPLTGQSCDACMVCSSAGECTDRAPSCCDTADIDSLIHDGFCGYIPEVYIPSGCTIVFDWLRQDDGSRATGERRSVCTNGVWGEVEHAGGGGPCSGCPPYYEDQWYTESCDFAFETPVDECEVRISD